MKSLLIKYSTFFIICVISFNAFSHEPNSETENSMSAFVHRELEKSYAQIRKIEISKSCNIDSDCKSVSVGNSPCGNPLPQLSYSINADIVTINSVLYYAQRIAFLEEVRMIGMTAECTFEEQPTLSCTSNICLSSKEFK